MTHRYCFPLLSPAHPHLEPPLAYLSGNPNPPQASMVDSSCISSHKLSLISSNHRGSQDLLSSSAVAVEKKPVQTQKQDPDESMDLWNSVLKIALIAVAAVFVVLVVLRLWNNAKRRRRRRRNAARRRR